MTTSVPKAPQGLSTSGKRLWKSILVEYDLETHEELLLKEACRAADRLDKLAIEANSSPTTVINSKGDQIAHPALSEARQQALVLSRLLASLRLPTGEEASSTARPQRRGASRGAYGLRNIA